jgi:hypothetical protein
MNLSIFVPGHSVVRMPDGSFQPSGLYQDIVYPTPGKSFPFRRTGIWNPAPDPDASTAYLGGGEVVVEASVALYRQLAQPGTAVALHMLGGRADYLETAASGTGAIDEAVVMKEMALRSLDGVSIGTFRHTRTTEDDIAAVVREVHETKPDRAFIVMMTFRIARAEAIAQKLVIEQPALETALASTVFCPAEQYVPRPGEYERMMSSAAYARTMANERFGIRRMLLGERATTGGQT